MFRIQKIPLETNDNEDIQWIQDSDASDGDDADSRTVWFLDDMATLLMAADPSSIPTSVELIRNKVVCSIHIFVINGSLIVDRTKHENWSTLCFFDMI